MITRRWTRRPRWLGPRLSRKDLKDLLYWTRLTDDDDDPGENLSPILLVITLLTVVRLLLWAILALPLYLVALLIRTAAVYFFRGAWTVEPSKNKSTETLRYEIRGWRKSKIAAAALARKLETGLAPSSMPELAEEAAS